jgi:copper(I)-binding protein
MKDITRRSFVLAACVGAPMAPRFAAAHGYKAGDIAVGHPWALPGPGPNGVAFVTLANRGRTSDKLIGASSPIARGAALRDADGLASKGLLIEAGRPLAMRPGARHIALTGLARDLVVGEKFALKLRFENAGEIEVEAVVEREPSD